jgi:hypothetical protein
MSTISCSTRRDRVGMTDPLAKSVAACDAYWKPLEPLTQKQERRKAIELQCRKGFVKIGETPTARVVEEIRSGEYERQVAESRKNLLKNRAKLLRWRREGYTFDAQHRLVAPPQPPAVTSSATPRPREHRPAGSSQRARAPDDPDPESDPPKRGRGRPGFPTAPPIQERREQQRFVFEELSEVERHVVVGYLRSDASQRPQGWDWLELSVAAASGGPEPDDDVDLLQTTYATRSAKHRRLSGAGPC